MPAIARAVCALTTLSVLLSGCVIEGPPSSPTTVELVNSTAVDVRPNLYTSSTASDASGLFVAGNLRTDFTARPFPELRAGETATLSLECADIQSIGVDAPEAFNATLLIITTSTEQIFLLRDTDFQCGDTVRFVYYAEGEAFHVRLETQ